MADGTRIRRSGLKLVAPRVADFLQLAHAMRPDEIEQFVATTNEGTYDPDKAARVFAGTTGPTFALLDRDGQPVGAGGFEPLRPGVYEAWGVGTLACWERYGVAISFVANRLIRALLAADAHRIQIVTLPQRAEARRWYEKGLGMQCEGVQRRYFGDGQDGVMYARVRT